MDKLGPVEKLAHSMPHMVTESLLCIHCNLNALFAFDGNNSYFNLNEHILCTTFDTCRNRSIICLNLISTIVNYDYHRHFELTRIRDSGIVFWGTYSIRIVY